MAASTAVAVVEVAAPVVVAEVDSEARDPEAATTVSTISRDEVEDVEVPLTVIVDDLLRNDPRCLSQTGEATEEITVTFRPKKGATESGRRAAIAATTAVAVAAADSAADPARKGDRSPRIYRIRLQVRKLSVIRKLV